MLYRDPISFILTSYCFVQTNRLDFWLLSGQNKMIGVKNLEGLSWYGAKEVRRREGPLDSRVLSYYFYRL